MNARAIDRRCPLCGSYVTAMWGRDWVEYECSGGGRHRWTRWGSFGGAGTALEEVFDVCQREEAFRNGEEAS